MGLNTNLMGVSPEEANHTVDHEHIKKETDDDNGGEKKEEGKPWKGFVFPGHRPRLQKHFSTSNGWDLD